MPEYRIRRNGSMLRSPEERLDRAIRNFKIGRRPVDVMVQNLACTILAVTFFMIMLLVFRFATPMASNGNGNGNGNGTNTTDGDWGEHHLNERSVSPKFFKVDALKMPSVPAEDESKEFEGGFFGPNGISPNQLHLLTEQMERIIPNVNKGLRVHRLNNPESMDMGMGVAIVYEETELELVHNNEPKEEVEAEEESEEQHEMKEEMSANRGLQLLGKLHKIVMDDDDVESRPAGGKTIIDEFWSDVEKKWKVGKYFEKTAPATGNLFKWLSKPKAWSELVAQVKGDWCKWATLLPAEQCELRLMFEHLFPTFDTVLVAKLDKSVHKTWTGMLVDEDALVDDHTLDSLQRKDVQRFKVLMHAGWFHRFLLARHFKNLARIYA